jgi:hypothetical protein
MSDQHLNDPASAAAQTLARYRAMLVEHDWEFEHSDDQRIWRLGRLALEQLQFLQREIDPDFKIWNEIAPLVYRRFPPNTDPRAHYNLDN